MASSDPITGAVGAGASPPLGAYVLATKYDDGDPGDHWAVGFYAGPHATGRHLVMDAHGHLFRATGFRRVAVITPAIGAWLLDAARVLEQAPAGTVNLWQMLTPAAFADQAAPA